MKSSSTLKEMLKVYDKHGWCRYNLAIDKDGWPVMTTDRSAASFCVEGTFFKVLGGIQSSLNMGGGGLICSYLHDTCPKAAAGVVSYATVGQINDRHIHSKRDAQRWIRRAIKLAEANND